jgi:hypothetical protein
VGQNVGTCMSLLRIDVQPSPSPIETPVSQLPFDSSESYACYYRSTDVLMGTTGSISRSCALDVWIGVFSRFQKVAVSYTGCDVGRDESASDRHSTKSQPDSNACVPNILRFNQDTKCITRSCSGSSFTSAIRNGSTLASYPFPCPLLYKDPSILRGSKAPKREFFKLRARRTRIVGTLDACH